MTIRLFIIYFIALSGIMGCATAKGISTITVNHYENMDVVTVESHKKEELSYKSGDVEVTYSSQTQSLLSRILSGVTLGVVGARK